MQKTYVKIEHLHFPMVGFEEGFLRKISFKTGFRIDQKSVVYGPMWSVLKKVLKAPGAQKPVSESIKSAFFRSLMVAFQMGFEGAWRSKTGFRINQKCVFSVAYGRFSNRF